MCEEAVLLRILTLFVYAVRVLVLCPFLVVFLSLVVRKSFSRVFNEAGKLLGVWAQGVWRLLCERLCG